jgi:amidase
MSTKKEELASSRRKFLKVSVAGAAGVALMPDLAAAQTPPVPEVAGFELDEATLESLQQGMESGKYTSRALVEKYLLRIAVIDKHGPTLGAVIEVNRDALTIAGELDQERRAKGARGPLHGIPVLIKDNIATDDKMQTTAGSLALVGAKVAKDSHVATRLREAGAVILGKTNCSEWANFRSTHSTSGWSGRGGQTRLPYALDRNPSGSSSGSGVAVAANLCAVAVGTETDGSIVSPSSSNGIVGIKPTVGLVSRSGIVPISHTQDTAGPMARTVADAAALLGVLAGIDPSDVTTADAKGHIEKDYTRFLDANGLRGARIGVVRKYAGYNDHVDRLLEAAIGVMKRAGAVIVDPVDVPTIGKFDDAELQVLLYEFKADLNAYLAHLETSQVRSLKDVIAFNNHHEDMEMRYFGQELMLQADAKGPLSSPDYKKKLADCRRMTRTEGIDAVMAKNRLDALIAPTGNPAWPTDLINGDHFTGSSTSLAAVAGYPNITVPMGDTFGLPVGLSFFGRAWSEPTLIKIAYSYEQATRLRSAPKFLPSLNLV